MSLPAKKGLAAMFLTPDSGDSDSDSDSDGPPSSRRGGEEDDKDEGDDKDEQEAADRVFEAAKGDDKAAFSDALLSLIYLCTKDS